MRGFAIVWSAVVCCCVPLAAAEPAAEHFDKAIAPLLARRCLDCHQGEHAQGGLDLSQRAKALAGGESGVAITPGKPDDSLLWQRVVDGDMPPKKPLPEAERELLKAWLASGATWGADPIDAFRFTTDTRAGYDWWALQPLQRPAIPDVKYYWPRHNSIDAFVQAKLASAGLQPSFPADRKSLARRLSFDLLGLPPTPEEVAAFVADPAPHAPAQLVDRWLASPHYGERWARHWLDVVRFGESQGFERDKLRTDSWRYRDWVVAAFNHDLPYDQFVKLQLAGDVLQRNDADAIAATGMLVAGPYDEVGKTQQSAAMKAVVRQDELEDLVGVVGQSFLGLTVNCARCHDHKFDPIRQTEYYQLAAALAGVEHGSRRLPASAQATVADARAALNQRKKLLEGQIDAIVRPVRDAIAREQQQKTEQTPLPVPLAEWTFDDDLKDQRGTLHAEEKSGAKRAQGELALNGQEAYAATGPIERELGEKTLVARVRLANTQQRGGGVISVQTLDGNTFDGIVFGEREPARWMAGSDFFRRTQSFAGPAEDAVHKNSVHMAIVYAADGTITAYRNGVPYGKAYKAEPQAFKAGTAQVVFGVRHTPVGSGKMLAGAIDHAQLFARALSAEEVARLAGVAAAPSLHAVLARLTAAQQQQHAALAFELAQLEDLHARYAEPTAYAVMSTKPHPVHLLARGEPGQPRQEVTAGGIASLVGLPADFGLSTTASDAERREKLAAWIANVKNPLVARVMVNRLWHYHFGVGLVETPNDFGFSGARPSHPELLDWLASELVDSGWSVKHVQRLILTSATYQQASLPNAMALAKDADNRLLWRKSPTRLDAETLRDALLATSGALVTDFAGPGFHDFTTHVHNSQFYEIVDAPGATFQRRSLYRTWIRSGRSPLLDAFDCPDPSTKTPARAVTTTPLQALSLLNSSFVLRTSDTMAERIAREAGDDPTRQIERLYQLAFSRAPTPAETAITTTFIREHGLAALVRVIFNSNEFLYVD